MKVKDLRKIIKHLPDDGEVLYDDPNFTGTYHIKPETRDFKIDKNNLIIGFPLESGVEF